MEQVDETQQMQNKVDKLKLLNLTNNIHSLTPPQKKDENDLNNVALVAALRVDPMLAEAVLNLQGRAVDTKLDFVQVTEPIMNVAGIWAFINCVCSTLAKNTQWGTYSEDEIPQRLTHYYEENLPTFIFNKKLFGLKSIHFNVIATYLKVFIDSSFHKAKQGKFINTLGRTYSEDLLNKALSNAEQKQTKQGLMERFLNPQPKK